MAIISTVTLLPNFYIPDPPLDSPFPIGEWRAAKTQAGDATGGYVAVVFAPPSASEAQKYLWSWEGASVQYVANLVAAITVTFAGITAEPIGGLSAELMAAATELLPNTVIGHSMSRPVPWNNMKRIHQPSGGLTNNYQIYVDGNANGVNYVFQSWGYIWHSEARRLASGPRRW